MQGLTGALQNLIDHGKKKKDFSPVTQSHSSSALAAMFSFITQFPECSVSSLENKIAQEQQDDSSPNVHNSGHLVFFKIPGDCLRLSKKRSLKT